VIPRLHLVSDDGILAREDFLSRAHAVLAAGGGAIALHLRGPATSGLMLYRLGAALAPRCGEGGSLLLVNDRVDVAVALGAPGVHLGQRSIPAAVARALLGRDAVLGLSVHGVGEADEESVRAVDFLVAGTIYTAGSHPGREGAGPGRVREIRGVCALPVLAIGGITPARVREVLEAGAHGVAVRGGVWEVGDPGEAVRVYLEELGGAPA
jgi:thiamine-phosphate pyrophosphorylase